MLLECQRRPLARQVHEAYAVIVEVAVGDQEGVGIASSADARWVRARQAALELAGILGILEDHAIPLPADDARLHETGCVGVLKRDVATLVEQENRPALEIPQVLDVPLRSPQPR